MEMIPIVLSSGRPSVSANWLSAENSARPTPFIGLNNHVIALLGTAVASQDQCKVMIAREGSNPTFVKPLKVVEASVKDDPGRHEGAWSVRHRHPVLARMKDFLARQRIDDRLLILGSLPEGAKTPECHEGALSQ